MLQRLLHERFEEYLAKTGGRGGPGERLARDAVAAAFTYAQRVNAHALVAGVLLQGVLAVCSALQGAEIPQCLLCFAQVQPHKY